MKNINNIPAFCINLKRRYDRKKQVQKEFNKIGLNVTFWEAVDGEKLIIPITSSKIDQYNAKGILGCLRSHTSLIQYAKSKNLEYIYVFEDDIIFCKDFMQRIKYIEKNVLGFDMFYLGGHFANESDIEKTDKKYIYKVNSMAGTYAYVLHNTIYDYILNICTSDLGMDQLYCEFVQKKFMVYAFIPFLVDHISGYSDIIQTFFDYPATHVHFKENL